MAGDSTSVHPGSPRSGGASAADLIDDLMHFDGPPEAFLANLLAVQCRLVRAAHAVVLGPGPGGKGEILAIHPHPGEGESAPPWVGAVLDAAQNASTDGTTVVKPLRGANDMYGQPATSHAIVVPLRRGGQNAGAVAGYLLETSKRPVLTAAQEKLELTVCLLGLYEARLTLQRRQGDLGRLRMAAEVLTSINEHDDFAGAAMTFCNESASRWQCDRVSLGFLKGRYVQLKALSNTEKFSRKMKLVQDIEGTMEECLDQDVEVIHPANQHATFVSRAAAELSGRHGPTSVLSLPLRRADKPAAVLTLERPADKPFALGEAEALRLTCDLCTPRLASLYASDRWIGARAVGGVRKGLAFMLGAKHTWIKLIILLILGGVVFLTFAEGDYEAEAPFELQAVRTQVVPALFDGRIDRAYVEPDDPVIGAGGLRRSWLLAPTHIRDAAGLARTIAEQASADVQPGKHISVLLAEAGGDDLREKLNFLLADQKFYASEAWSGAELTVRQKALLADRSEGDLPAAALTELNRSLLDAAYPQYVAPGPTVLATLKRPSWLLAPTHIKDATGLARTISKQASANAQPGKHISPLLAKADGDDLREKLNGLLADPAFYTSEAWSGVELTARQEDLLADRSGNDLPPTRATELNRSLLAAAYPQYVARGPTVLATLKTDELEMELATRLAERTGYVLQQDAARNAVEDKTQRGTQADVEIAQAKIDQVTAQIDLLEFRISQAVIVSAIDGYVAQGDLKRQLGAPVKKGDVLFEVISNEAMRAELAVPEDLIADVREAEARAKNNKEVVRGELAATARPESRVAFELERIIPVAEVVDQKNVFTVRVRVIDLPDVLKRPGVAGVARIHIGRRSYGYIYTRRLINWVRMKFWL